MKDIRYYMGEFYEPAYIVFKGDVVYRLSDTEDVPAEKYIAVSNSGAQDFGHFHRDGEMKDLIYLDLVKVYSKIDLYTGKLTPSQQRTTEWLVGEAQKSFLESEINKTKRIFNWKLTEGHKSICLTVATEAKPDTGQLFMLDGRIMIWIGKKGGIKSAKNTANNLISDYKAIVYAKKGIFAL